MNADRLLLYPQSRFGTAPILVSIVSHDAHTAFEARPLDVSDQRLRVSGQRDARSSTSA